MAHQTWLFLASLLLSCLAQTSLGMIHFSSLKKTIVVTASPKQDQVLKASDDKMTVTWAVNKSLPAGTGSDYKTFKVKLCYAPISQKGRGWRKTEDELSKDKTCQHKIVTKPYTAGDNSIEWTVQSDVPQGTYFVRVYALDAAGHEVAYGQSTDDAKHTNLFVIQAVTGRHRSMDIASVCFSAFSIIALFGFFIAEKRKAKTQK